MDKLVLLQELGYATSVRCITADKLKVTHVGRKANWSKTEMLSVKDVMRPMKYIRRLIGFGCISSENSVPDLDKVYKKTAWPTYTLPQTS